ncbi:TPA: HAD hydrolase-like protein, partial [Enterococcus faecium]|nr:HAD hydrolase-like protein [Enterococcus faecium]
AIALERKCEVALAFQNKALVEVLKKLKDLGTRIIITTDMYLDNSVLESILKNNSIPYDYLFVSGNIGMAKYTGRLFDHVVKSLNIDKNAFIHIGDTLEKDVIAAKKMGYNAMQYAPKKEQFDLIKKQFKNNDILYNFSRENLVSQKSPHLNENWIGYGIIGPFLHGFCNWIKNNAQKDDVIWFVSREGYLIEKVYSALKTDKDCDCEYVTLNKNVLRLPALHCDESIDMFLATIPRRKTISIKIVIQYLEVVINRKIDVDLQSDIERELTIKDAKQNHEFLCDYANILKNVQPEIVEQSELFVEYVKTRLHNKNRVLLVNNSMHGNGQFLLCSVLKNYDMPVEVIGYQFFKSKMCEKKGVRCNAWLDYVGVPWYIQDSFERNCLLFEHILFESQGTALRLYKIENEILTQHKNHGVESKNNELVHTIQKAVIEFVVDYDQCCLNEIIKSRNYAYPFFSFLLFPTKEQVECISKIIDADDIGESTSIVNSEQNAEINNAFNYNNFKRSGWKQGYLLSCGYDKAILVIVTLLLAVKSKVDGR